MKKFIIQSHLFLLTLFFFFASMDIAVHSETVKRIPVAKGLASHPVNGGHCLISDGTYQYLAFYDGDHQATVAKRKLGDDQWDFAKLPERVGWDTHNKLVLFRDREGYLHLTGNMHVSPLNYYRTEKPGDIHTFKGIHRWTGKYEDRVTYPTLIKLRDGSIHMMFRHGGSGRGMRLLVHYDEKTQTWSGTGDSFINGKLIEPDCNAYPFGGIKEDRQGTLHIAWCWRETPDVETNFDICYAKSTDGGYTWTSWDGEQLELPIQPTNADVVDDIEQKRGLMNGGSLVVDADGIPYIGFTRFDKNDHNQLFVATPHQGQWVVKQLTDWNVRFWFEGRGTIPHYPPIPRLSILGDEHLQVRYSFDLVEPSSGKLNMTRAELLNATPGSIAINANVTPKTNEPKVRNVRASNIGPLPEGQNHYMQQETSRPNRDRKPDNPKEPTMIYIVEVHR